MKNELKHVFKFFFILFILLIVFGALSNVFIYLDKAFLGLLGVGIFGNILSLVYNYEISKVCSGSLIMATTIALVLSDGFGKKMIRSIFCFIILFFYNIFRIYLVLIYGTIFHISSWMFFIIVVFGTWYLSIKMFLDDESQDGTQTTKGLV